MKTLELVWKDGRYQVAGEQPADKPGKEIHLAQGAGVLGGIDRIEVLGIPVGRAVIGGTSALLVGEVLDGLFPADPRNKDDSNRRSLIKFLAAWALAQFGPKLMGKEAATLGAGLLAFEAARDLLPIDDLVGKFTDRVSGVLAKKKPQPTADGRLVLLAQETGNDSGGSGDQDSGGAGGFDYAQGPGRSPVLERRAFTNV